MDYKKDIGLLYENILIDEAAGALNYWLTPTGELERVYNHVDYNDENINLDEFAEAGEDLETIYERAYILGYIRVVMDSNNVYFSYNISKKPSKEQFTVLFNLANDKKKNLVDGETQKVIVQNNAESSDSLGKNEQLTKLDRDLQPSFYKNSKSYQESKEKFPLKDYTKLIYENLYSDDEPEEKETVGLRGEYWFEEDGSIIYADGDIGDVGHEGIVIQYCAGQLSSEFDLYMDEPYFDTDSPAEESILQIILKDDDFISEHFKVNVEDFEDSDIDFAEIFENDPASAIISYLEYKGMSNEKASEMVFTAYGSTSDARQLAINVWNWKRVQGDSIESKTLTKEDLKIIARGINNALDSEGLLYEYEDDPDVLDLHEYDISTYTGNRYSITLRDMESGNVENLERADIETPISAATAQVRDMDVSTMNDYYKAKGVIGDHFLKDYTKLIYEKS